VDVGGLRDAAARDVVVRHRVALHERHALVGVREDARRQHARDAPADDDGVLADSRDGRLVVRRDRIQCHSGRTNAVCPIKLL